MRPHRTVLGALAVVTAVAVSAGSARAQLPHKVDSTLYRLLFENDRVRVYEAQFKPGDSIGMHVHPANYAYALTAGTFVVDWVGGKADTLRLKAGDGQWSDGDPPHATKNIGTTAARFLLTELKEPPAPKKEVKK